VDQIIGKLGQAESEPGKAQALEAVVYKVGGPLDPRWPVAYPRSSRMFAEDSCLSRTTVWLALVAAPEMVSGQRVPRWQGWQGWKWLR
jgi:hypothetical protein